MVWPLRNHSSKKCITIAGTGTKFPLRFNFARAAGVRFFQMTRQNMKRACHAIAISLSLWGGAAGAEEVCDILNGSVIIAQDSNNTFLGKVASSFDSQSIFNEFGTYGNEFSSKSIWNEFSTFGNEFNSNSPFNEFSSAPPMLIKNRKIVGYLSANKSLRGSISPNLLKALCKDSF